MQGTSWYNIPKFILTKGGPCVGDFALFIVKLLIICNWESIKVIISSSLPVYFIWPKGLPANDASDKSLKNKDLGSCGAGWVMLDLKLFVNAGLIPDFE